MNDNPRRHRPRFALIIGGLPDKPDACFCGSGETYVDAPTSPGGHVGPYRVDCGHCGASGPDASTYDAAVALWNEMAEAINKTCYIVDNNTN
jgi:hypothetical protein